MRHRPGVAMIWVLVILAAVSVFSVAAVRHYAMARRTIDLERERNQAMWLARSGYELAIDRLLASPDYTGETAALVPRSEIKITVKKDAAKDLYEVQSEARYGIDNLSPSRQIITRRVKRIPDGKGFRIEQVP